MEELNNYLVTCKGGHTGSKDTFYRITLPIKAASGVEAAEIGRHMPRCKHNHPDCVLEVKKCSEEELLAQRMINDEDPYFKCSSYQEQQLLGVNEELFEEDTYNTNRYNITKEEKEYTYRFKKNLIRNPKKFFNSYCNDDCYDDYDYEDDDMEDYDYE